MLSYDVHEMSILCVVLIGCYWRCHAARHTHFSFSCRLASWTRFAA